VSTALSFYKLLVMEENLREKGHLMCIIAKDKDAGSIFNPRNYSALFDNNKNGRGGGLLNSINDDGWNEFLELE
jgi:hypothetical protein